MSGILDDLDAAQTSELKELYAKLSELYRQKANLTARESPNRFSDWVIHKTYLRRH